MFAHYDRLINIRQLRTGRRLFALRGVRERAAALQKPQLIELLDMAIAHDEKQTQVLNARWQGAQRGAAKPASEPARAADAAFDELLAGIDATLVNVPRVWGQNSPEAKQAAELRALFFPGGLAAVTQTSWVDEVEQGRRIARAAENAGAAPLLSALGLSATVPRLKAVVAALERELKRDVAGQAFSEVRKARHLGQNLLRAVISKILGDTALPSAENEATRSELLAPILAQDDAVAIYSRARRAAPDVNPDTGVEDPTSEEPAAAS